MKELKVLFNNYKVALDEMNKAEEEWSKNPCDVELEKISDEAYEREYNIYNELLNKIVELGKNQISKGTAATMINTRFEDLEELINKIA